MYRSVVLLCTDCIITGHRVIIKANYVKTDVDDVCTFVLLSM